MKSRFDYASWREGAVTVCRDDGGRNHGGKVPGWRHTQTVNRHRRACVGGFSASLSTPLFDGCATASNRTLPSAKLVGTDARPGADDGGRLIDHRLQTTGPIPGLVARRSNVGEVSGRAGRRIPDVRYAGPDVPRHPLRRGAIRRAVEWCERLLPALARSIMFTFATPFVRPVVWWLVLQRPIRFGDNIWAFSTRGVELWRSQDLVTGNIVASCGRSSATAAGSSTGACAAASRFARCGRRRFTISRLICHLMSRGGIAVLEVGFRRCQKAVRACLLARATDPSGIDATLFQDDDGSVWLTLGAASEIDAAAMTFRFGGPGAQCAWPNMILAPSHHRAQCADVDFRHLAMKVLRCSNAPGVTAGVVGPLSRPLPFAAGLRVA